MSGVMLLPFILAHLVVSLGTGLAISRVGYVQPFLLGGAAVLTVGLGVFTLCRPDTTRTDWIIWQIIIGCGSGAGLQVAMLPAQILLPNEDTSEGISILNFGFVLGGAVFVPVAQNILLNRLAVAASPLTSKEIADLGVTQIVGAVPADKAQHVVDGINGAIKAVFYCATALAAMSFVGGVGIKPTLSVKKGMSQNHGISSASHDI